DLLGGPDDRAQGEQQDAVADADAVGHRGGGREGDGAVEDRRTGHEMVCGAHRFETGLPGEACTGADVTEYRLRRVGGRGGQDDADVHENSWKTVRGQVRRTTPRRPDLFRAPG